MINLGGRGVDKPRGGCDKPLVEEGVINLGVGEGDKPRGGGDDKPGVGGG